MKVLWKTNIPLLFYLLTQELAKITLQSRWILVSFCFYFCTTNVQDLFGMKIHGSQKLIIILVTPSPSVQN